MADRVFGKDTFERYREQDSEFYANEFVRKHYYQWDFNHIVGWIGLYRAGNQIRAWLHFVDLRPDPGRPGPRPLRRDNRRPIRSYDKLWEGSDFSRLSSREIYESLLRELETAVRTHDRLKGRFVDLGPFKAIGPHVNWRAVLYPD